MAYSNLTRTGELWAILIETWCGTHSACDFWWKGLTTRETCDSCESKNMREFFLCIVLVEKGRHGSVSKKIRQIGLQGQKISQCHLLKRNFSEDRKYSFPDANAMQTGSLCYVTEVLSS